MLLCSGDKLVVRPMSCVDVPSELQIVCTVKSSVPGSSAKISRARTDWSSSTNRCQTITNRPAIPSPKRKSAEEELHRRDAMCPVTTEITLARSIASMFTAELRTSTVKVEYNSDSMLLYPDLANLLNFKIEFVGSFHELNQMTTCNSGSSSGNIIQKIILLAFCRLSWISLTKRENY